MASPELRDIQRHFANQFYLRAVVLTSAILTMMFLLTLWRTGLHHTIVIRGEQLLQISSELLHDRPELAFVEHATADDAVGTGHVLVVAASRSFRPEPANGEGDG
jgi:hypothetical protein